MTRTFQAILKGDHVEWLGEAPLLPEGAEVEITVVERLVPAEVLTDDQRREKLRDIFDRLVASGAAELYGDGVEFQREVRKDRPLPGRED